MRLALAFVLTCAPLAAAASPSLQDELAALAKNSRSTVGIYVEHLEKHETAGVNATRPFPLASTFKLPLAIVVLGAVEKQALPGLDGNVHLEASDMRGWASPLHQRLPEGGDVTLREVLSSLLETSDNSAADALLRLAGGGARVTAALHALGLDGIGIDRNKGEMALDSHGVAHPPARELTAARLHQLLASAPPEQQRRAVAKLMADPRDHGSPAAMGRVVARLWRGELPLTKEHAAFVRQEMTRCQTGVRRLRAGLPEAAAVADRTGTCYDRGDDLPPCANDIGLLTLPSGEHVVVAVMIEDAGAPLGDKEKTMAAVARAVWQRYEKR